MTAKPRPREDDEYEVELVTADDPTFNVMLVGEPGSGKTTMAATAQDHPEMRDVLFGNIEGGMLSIAHRGDIHKRDIRSTRDVVELGWQIAKGRFPSVKTVVIDNITELQTLDLQEEVQNAIDHGKNKINKGTPTQRDRTVDDVWQEDWQKSTMRLKRLFRFFRDLPVNVIFTAHVKRVYPKVPEGTDLKKVQPILLLPALSQSLMESTMGYVDFVWYLEIDEESEQQPAPRFLVTQPSGLYRAKTRCEPFADAIGPVVENPSLPELYNTFVRTALKPATPRSTKKR